MSSRIGSYLETWSGVRFYPLDPRPEEILIEDIAHALARVCRFGGHVDCDIYSVAQHSVMVASLCPPECALEGLLHDAAEAYVGDMVSPLKLHLRDYRSIEHGVHRAVAARFKLFWVDGWGHDGGWPLDVQIADEKMLATEARDLKGADPKAWGIGESPLLGRISPWGVQEAEERFLEAFEQLSSERRAA